LKKLSSSLAHNVLISGQTRFINAVQTTHSGGFSITITLLNTSGAGIASSPASISFVMRIEEHSDIYCVRLAGC